MLSATATSPALDSAIRTAQAICHDAVAILGEDVAKSTGGAGAFRAVAGVLSGPVSISFEAAMQGRRRYTGALRIVYLSAGGDRINHLVAKDFDGAALAALVRAQLVAIEHAKARAVASTQRRHATTALAEALRKEADAEWGTVRECSPESVGLVFTCTPEQARAVIAAARAVGVKA